MGWGQSCQFMKQKTESFMKILATKMKMVHLAMLSFKD